MTLRHPRRFPDPQQIGLRLRGAGGWLPGSITLANVLMGFAAILHASRGNFLLASVLILGATVLDGLDGRVARLTGTVSEFGEELDSLADAISFAVAPAILAFHLGLEDLHRPGWAVAFLFAACGVIRLARFSAGLQDHRYFIGLPIPTAAAAAACPPLLTDGARVPEPLVPAYAVVIAVLSLLMVSKIRFRSFKDLRFGPRPYRVLAVWALILAGLYAFGEWALPALIVIYLLSPGIGWLMKRGQRPAAEALPDAPGETPGAPHGETGERIS